jgi:NADH-quinone oxidoreductase subunit H
MELLLIAILKAIAFILLFLTVAAVLTYVERRISAFIQDRLGPNRVGPFGLFQPVADLIKILFKEEIIPANADKTLHTIAPIISLFVAYSIIAVLPIGEKNRNRRKRD